MVALCLIAGAPAALAADGEGAAAPLLATYFEGLPGQGGALAQALGAYAARRGASPAHPRVDVLAEQGRAGRMVVVESWPAGAVADDAPLAALEQQVAPLIQAPADARRHAGLTPLLGAGAKGRFHMVMHLDVVPAGAAMAARELVELRGSVLAARGAIGFEAATQEGKPNHFAVHEIWTSRAAYEAWAAGAAARGLRARLATAKGALFDDRFYDVVPALRGKGN
jgi:quinol monooxygenase YgiN